MSILAPIVSTMDISAVQRLTYSERENLKDAINATDPHFIFEPAGDSRNPDRRKIICPICGNGTGKDATPVVVDRENNVWKYHCFKCDDFNGDLMKLIASENNLDLNKAADLYRALAIGASIISYPLPEETTFDEEQVFIKTDINADINADINEAKKNLSNLPESQRRGLTLETFQHFGCGYLTAWIHPKSRAEKKKVFPSRRIIIPSGNHYNAVALPEDRKTIDKKYHKMHAGTKTEIFNSAALYSEADLIVVVEGEIDAMSIWQATGGSQAVVATLSAGGYTNNLLPIIDNGKVKVNGKKFLILFDADETGRKHAENLCQELLKRKVPAVAKFFSDVLNDDDKKFFGTKVDANQILQSEGNDFLRSLIEDIIRSAQIDFATLQETTAENSAKQNMDAQTKHELDEAISWLKTLEPENFTAGDARNFEHIHFVALAQTFNYSAEAENFFTVIKKAKELARLRLKNAESGLTAKLSETETKEISALVEGININFLRGEVDREITQIKRAQNKFQERQAKELQRAEEIKRAQQRKQTVKNTIRRLIELRAEYAKNPSPELAARIQNLIFHVCDVIIDRYGNIKCVEATQRNVDLIFTFDPYLDGLFGYDQFQQADVFLRPPLWNPDARKGDEWKDRDDAQLQAYLRKTYVEFTNEKLILNSVTVYSDAHKFHEVKEFFRSLPKWDGKPRAKKLFVKFLGADDTPYVEEITLNILTAAIARIFNPGCDYQTAPILLGEQGIGKSHCLSRLFGKWYGSLVDDVGDPHAIDAIQKLWGVEIKEMAAMKKDIDANKRFIDSAKDTRRQAYARRATTIPRHCVFVITTNNKMCLTDMTGNRRYPIIVCHNKPRHYVEGLTDEYILQVWAEVYVYYQELFKDGFDEKKLELSRDAQMQSDEIAEEYLRDDGLATEIQGYLDTLILPLILWHLLTREERRKFIAEGRLVILDAIAEFNSRRRARGGTESKVQQDVDLITSCLTKTQDKHWLRIIHKTIQGNDVDEFILYGSEIRQHICAVEIYNECFGNDRRKSPTRINEILNNLNGWSLGARIRNIDPAYPDQKKVFYRNNG